MPTTDRGIMNTEAVSPAGPGSAGRLLRRLSNPVESAAGEESRVKDREPVATWLTDMDGVLIHEGSMIPGADEFIRKLRDRGVPFLVLTNNSIYTPRDLRARLLATGIDLPEES